MMADSFNLFAYGTLMSKAVMASVTGIRAEGEQATLRGYRSMPVRGELYPGLRPDPGQVTSGKLYRDLPVDALPALDAFEGDEYERIKVEVALETGEKIVAEAFVTVAACRHTLIEGNWDHEAFERHWLRGSAC